jgi:hypothetical protein
MTTILIAFSPLLEAGPESFELADKKRRDDHLLDILNLMRIMHINQEKPFLEILLVSRRIS